MAGHWFSMNMQMVTRSLLVYRITGSGTILGFMGLANSIPMLTLSLLGGVIADRVDKKRVLFLGQGASGLISLSVALALTLGYLSPEHPESWWFLAVSSALQGAIMGLMLPSRQAMIPDIVGEEQLMNAISLNTLGMNVFTIAAPALAGFLIDAFNFSVVYYSMTGMYFLATFGISFLPKSQVRPSEGGSTLNDITEGLSYVRRERVILTILLFSLACTILGMPHRLLLPMFTEDILKTDATGLGLLMSVSGIGALTGSLILASLPNKKRGLMQIISGLLFGLGLVGFAFSRSLYFSLAMMFFVGIGQTGQQLLSTTQVQYHVDASYRGRVLSIMMMGFGMASLGTFFAGILAQTIGPQWSIGGLATVLTMVALVILVFAPRLRKLD
jgi:MFS family permease